jgi:hypothetical protein
MEKPKRKRAKGASKPVQREERQVGLSVKEQRLVKEILSDVESYIVAWSLTNTVEMMEQMIEERESGLYPNGVFEKNKAKDLRLIKDHRDAAKIVLSWYQVPGHENLY